MKWVGSWADSLIRKDNAYRNPNDQFFGRIHIAFDSILASPALEAANWYHAWDEKNTADLELYFSCIHDPKRGALVQNVLAAFQRELMLINGMSAGFSDVGDSIRR